jgi:hypothetical protein
MTTSAANTNPTPEATMIEELKALAEKATPGPWRVDTFADMIFSCDVEREKAETEAICDLRYFHTPDDEANAALIVTLVNNLPAILSALEAVPVMKEALEDIGIYGCGMLNQPIELNQPPEQWMKKRIERMEQVARQALAALEGK